MSSQRCMAKFCCAYSSHSSSSPFLMGDDSHGILKARVTQACLANNVNPWTLTSAPLRGKALRFLMSGKYLAAQPICRDHNGLVLSSPGAAPAKALPQPGYAIIASSKNSFTVSIDLHALIKVS